MKNRILLCLTSALLCLYAGNSYAARLTGEIRNVRVHGVYTCKAINGLVGFCQRTDMEPAPNLGAARPCTIRYGCWRFTAGPAQLLTPAERCEGDPDACASGGE